MNNRCIVGPATLTVCLLTLASSCGSDGVATTPESAPTEAPRTTVDEAKDEPTTSAPPEDTTTTAVPTTAAPVLTEPEAVEPPTTAATSTSTTEPAGDTIVVPFHILDLGFPVGWTCDDASPGFNVSFTDESGDRSIVEARFNNSSRPAPEDSNAACAIEPFEGVPALFITAQLVVPAAETYQLIEIRYPFFNGAGNDRYDTVAEMVTSEQAHIGIYLGDGLLDPSDAADLPFPVVG